MASEEETLESDDDFKDAEEHHEGLPSKLKANKLGKPFQNSDSEASDVAEGDEDTGGWGTSREDYYNADVIETEADALEEEAEAIRLQQKQLQGMTEADFGFDEIKWLETGKDGMSDEDDGGNGVVREILPKLEITEAMGPEERMEILRIRYPEFEPLAKEFIDLQEPHTKLKMRAKEAEEIQSHQNDGVANGTQSSMHVMTVKYRALSAYLSALSMYFALLTSGAKGSDANPTAMPPEQLRDHAVMGTLLQCRDLWGNVKDIEELEPVVERSESREKTIDAAESLLARGQELHDSESRDLRKKRGPRKSKSQRLAEVAQAEAETRRISRICEMEDSLADLSALTAPSRLKKSSELTAKQSQPAHYSDSDLGDQTSLTPAEAAEKAKRKKSLRFYTSQIAQKSNKRGAAGRDAGGDADIPYRERLKDRQARLNAEAEKRGTKTRGQGEGDELGGDSDEDDRAAAKALRESGSGEEDYYDLISSKAAKRKEEKTALSALQTQARAEGGIVRIVEDDRVGEDGKRAISYAIEKNKGLTPKRKKDVRNPRVKKRKKFEDKKKKLGSIRPVYQGGEGRGGYKGELTGIKKGLVRGVRL